MPFFPVVWLAPKTTTNKAGTNILYTLKAQHLYIPGWKDGTTDARVQKDWQCPLAYIHDGKFSPTWCTPSPFSLYLPCTSKVVGYALAERSDTLLLSPGANPLYMSLFDGNCTAQIRHFVHTFFARKKIRLREVNAKCRHLKKLTCKEILRQVFFID